MCAVIENFVLNRGIFTEPGLGKKCGAAAAAGSEGGLEGRKEGKNSHKMEIGAFFSAEPLFPAHLQKVNPSLYELCMESIAQQILQC